MSGKTGDYHASMEAASLLPKQMSNHTASGGNTSEVPAFVKKHPVFLYSRDTLPPGLRENINTKWEACWPINVLRPLVLLDLLSYLLFIKKLEDLQLISGMKPATSPNVLSKKINNGQIGWSSFSEMDAQNMHKIFLHENGLYELIKNYGLTNLRYSVFLREPLLLTPTPTLLSNVVNIIKIMHQENNDTNAVIFEYLIHKAETEGQNKRVYGPDYVVKLMIEMMEPATEDVIWDPSAGNGCFLVNSAKYIANKNAALNQNAATNLVEGSYHGIECDPVQLRIGAMNMILHGIEEPKVEGINIFSKANRGLRKQPTLILCNLFFEGTEDKVAAGVNALQTDTAGKDVRLLSLILKSLKKDGRAAVITREYLMNNHMPEITAVRKELIDNHKLEAVISLPNKAGSLFCGAAILIFNEGQSFASDKVWFYKIKHDTNIVDSDVLKPNSRESAFIDEYEDVREILALWKTENKEVPGDRDNSFYVSIDEIKNNNYNLSFGEYRRILKKANPDAFNGKAVSVEGNIPVNPLQKKQVLVVIRQLTAQSLWMIKKSLTDFIVLARKNMAVIPARRKQISTGLFSIFKKRFSYLIVLVKRNLPVNPIQKKVGGIKKPFAQQLLPGIKKQPINFISLIVIIAAMFAVYFIYFNNKNENVASTATRQLASPGAAKAGYPANNPVTVTQKSRILTPEQIQAILKDTSGIIHFKDESGELPDSIIHIKGTAIESGNAESLVDKKAGEVRQVGTSEHLSGVQYTVIDTAFFHNQPDEKTSRKTYLDPLNHNVLKPIQDKNGFIYIVYTNHAGRTSKGWINKKDLIPLE